MTGMVVGGKELNNEDSWAQILGRVPVWCNCSPQNDREGSTEPACGRAALDAGFMTGD